MEQPRGIQGFASIKDAEISARTELGGVPFVIMCNRYGNYGWMAPVPYAERVAERNNLFIEKRSDG